MIANFKGRIRRFEKVMAVRSNNSLRGIARILGTLKREPELMAELVAIVNRFQGEPGAHNTCTTAQHTVETTNTERTCIRCGRLNRATTQ